MNITQLDGQSLHHNFLSFKIMNKSYFIKQPVCTTYESDFRDVQLIELFLNQPPLHIGDRLIIDNFGEIEGSVISEERSSIHIMV